jgi:hypothetical protein
MMIPGRPPSTPERHESLAFAKRLARHDLVVGLRRLPARALVVEGRARLQGQSGLSTFATKFFASTDGE